MRFDQIAWFAIAFLAAVAPLACSTGTLDGGSTSTVDAGNLVDAGPNDGGSGPCDDINCGDHGACEVFLGAARCACDSAYHEQDFVCVLDQDPCEGIDCSNYGTCLVEGSEAHCTCDNGYVAQGLSCLPETCALNQLMCSGECIEPLTDERYCGAQGDCLGSNAGEVCGEDRVCTEGACEQESSPQVDLYVSLQGRDEASCGAAASPCRTLEYSAEQRASAGQVIGILPGIYDETGAVDLPKEISVVGLGDDASEVVLRPDYAMAYNEYFIRLDDANLSQDGRQSLSYVTLEAHAAAHTGAHALLIRNRNNVRVHHCRFTNWDREYDPPWDAYTILVDTSYAFPYHTADWKAATPLDPGEPGDYENWVDWPTDPVTQFEFDHNFVYRCGSAQKGVSERPGAAMHVRNAKDSRIHHNEFDLRGVFARGIVGITGFWDNVDVYGNVLRATDAYLEGWFAPDAKSRSVYVLEVWSHINGCEHYNNISNDGFSLVNHKESSIHNNILLRHVNGSIAIEFGWLHYSEVRNNYIMGGKGMGMFGPLQYFKSTDAAVFGNILINIQQWGLGVYFDRQFCNASNLGVSNYAVYNNLIDATRYGSIYVRANCETALPPAELFIRNNILMNAGEGRAGVNFEMGPEYGSFVSAVENNLFFNNDGGESQCKCFDEDHVVVPCVDGCDNRGAVQSVTEDPMFISPDIVIVNDTDSDSTSRQGTWATKTADELRAYGDGVSVHAGGAGDYFEFQAGGLPQTTPTLVALWWPRNLGQNRSSEVPVAVYDGSGTSPVATYTIDQASWDSSGWYYLGMHVFSSGSSRIRVESVAGEQVVADAALWSKLGAGYQLQQGSPGINAGSAGVTGVVDFDFFGNSVPSGSAPDIGIHER